MACQFDRNRKSFTFTWILENFEYCVQKTGNSLQSPTFIAADFERSKWSLCMYPRGTTSKRWISLYLCREEDSKGPSTIQIDSEFAILALDGSPLASEFIYKYAFPKLLPSAGYGFASFIKRETVFAKRSTFLPEGALTIRVKMWKTNGEADTDGHCFARTLIGIKRSAFLWKIPNFFTSGVEREETYRLKSTSDDKVIMSLKLFLRKNESSYSIVIKLVLFDKSIVFSKFKSSLVDAKSNYVDCGQHELWFSPTLQSTECMLSVSKDTMTGNKDLYLPFGALTLYCEQTFSTGTAFQGIEDTVYGCSRSFKTNNVVSANIKSAYIKKSDSETSYLKTDLGSMLHGNILCDVKLCVESETFPAHRLILSARSPVFRSMFQSDMKEKVQGRINILDLTPDTVRRMLLYMYTDSLEELEWKTASDLYVAAEKYQIMSLKDKCSVFLESNLSLSNACEILLLTDLLQDKKLKSTVQNFIMKNDKSIISSSDWEHLMKDNLPLAAETMLLRYKE